MVDVLLVYVLSVEFGPCRGGAAINPSPGAMPSPAAPVPPTPPLVVLRLVETLDGWNSELRQLPVMCKDCKALRGLDDFNFEHARLPLSVREQTLGKSNF